MRRKDREITDFEQIAGVGSGSVERNLNTQIQKTFRLIF